VLEEEKKEVLLKPSPPPIEEVRKEAVSPPALKQVSFTEDLHTVLTDIETVFTPPASDREAKGGPIASKTFIQNLQTIVLNLHTAIFRLAGEWAQGRTLAKDFFTEKIETIVLELQKFVSLLSGIVEELSGQNSSQQP